MNLNPRVWLLLLAGLGSHHMLTVADTIECTTPADIIILLDESGSIWDHDFNHGLEFIVNLLSSFDVNPEGVHVGVAAFSNEVYTIIELGEFVDDVDSIIMAVQSYRQQGYGFTQAYLALEYCHQQMLSHGHRRPRIAVLITDGEINEPDIALSKATLLKESGVHLFVIGLGLHNDMQTIEAITSSEEFAYSVEDYAALEGIREKLTLNLCTITSSMSMMTRTSLQAQVVLMIYIYIII